ncbi:MAG: SUF system NifU family Fe-S cluster assembly protein [Deltaproteobacteria bacterium]|nr:SUF system NifU family Fe-S cluster assembly protein [Deltaproteobacteria bacterium]
MSLDELYQDVILDHYKKPRCHGSILNPDCRSSLHNPLCGDTIDLMVSIQDGKVNDIAFSGHGCSISQAGASMMTELCKGKSVQEVKDLCKVFRSMMRGEKSSQEIQVLGDAVALEGVRRFSARIKCALLAWDALEKCMEQAEDLSCPTESKIPA